MAGVKKYKRDEDFSYSLGITLTFELVKFKPEMVRRVYVHSSMKKGDTLDKMISICKDIGVEIVYSDKIFNVVSKKENCYIIGEFSKYESSLEKDANHIVLVNPSNAGNMGTIMRSSLGFNMNNMAIIRPGVDAFDPKVVRASMGALFSTNFVYYDSFSDYLEEFGDRELYPFMLQAEKRLYDVEERGRFSLIFGNEATGLPEEFLNYGTPLIIPHSDKIDSLNLPIAASIAMYEMNRA